MASRNTLKEIKELEAEWKSSYPKLTFVIDRDGGESRMFPGAIEAQGLQDDVIRWEEDEQGKSVPVVKWEKYEIHELVSCADCGREWKNSAIGQETICPQCRENFRQERDPRSDAEVRADAAAQRVADERADDWNE